MKPIFVARSPIAARVIVLRDNHGKVNDQTSQRIFDAIAEIDFSAIIKAKLDEHEIRAAGLEIEVNYGESLETQPN